MTGDDVSKYRHQYNRWGVGSSPDGKEIRILGLFAGIRGASDGPGQGLGPLLLTREHGLELAAWIVAIAMPKDGEFERILAYIRGEPVA